MTRLVRWGLLCLCVFASSACAPLSSTQPAIVIRAQNELVRDQSRPEPWLDLAGYYLTVGDLLRASQYLRNAEQRHPSGASAERLMRLGLRIEVQSQQYSLAIERCLAWLREHDEPLLRDLLSLLRAAVAEAAPHRTKVPRQGPLKPRNALAERGRP